MNSTFTGRHMAIIMVGFFAVVVAVNLGMARLASSTFGGVVVQNSYVASQHYNRWLDEAAAQKALGWRLTAARAADDRLTVTVAGPAGGDRLTALARHPLGRLPDQGLTFSRMADGSFLSDQALPKGRWVVRLALKSGGRVVRAEQELR